MRAFQAFCAVACVALLAGETLARAPGGRPGGGGPPRMPGQSSTSGQQAGGCQRGSSTASSQTMVSTGTPRSGNTSYTPPTVEQLVQYALSSDENGDGKLSADEVPSRLRTLLTDFDANEDGALDAAELTLAAQKFLTNGKLAKK